MRHNIAAMGGLMLATFFIKVPAIDTTDPYLSVNLFYHALAIPPMQKRPNGSLTLINSSQELARIHGRDRMRGAEPRAACFPR